MEDKQPRNRRQFAAEFNVTRWSWCAPTPDAFARSSDGSLSLSFVEDLGVVDHDPSSIR
jgi:hypothetical protein